MPMNKHTKKAFLAVGPTVDIIIARGMLTTTSTKNIQGRATITIIDRAKYPSNEAAGALSPRAPITLQVTHLNSLARSKKLQLDFLFVHEGPVNASFGSASDRTQ